MGSFEALIFRALKLPMPPGHTGAPLKLTVPRFLHVEPYSLRQRHLSAPIDGIGLAPHIGLPGIRARLAPAAGVLFAAERTADFRAGGSKIDVGNAAVAAVSRQEPFSCLQAVGKYRRRESIVHRVLQRQRFLERLKA